MKKIRISFLKAMLLAAVFTAAIALSACGTADISSYKDKTILVTGLTDEDFTVTVEELSLMECVSGKAVGETEKAGTVKAYGPTLKTFVEHYGASLDDFYMIRATASDDYKVLLGAASWEEYDVILSIANGSKPLESDEQPMRIVIPGGKSGNWERMVVKLEFVRME